MKKLLTFLFSLLLGILACLALFKYFVSWKKFGEELVKISFTEWAVVIFLAFVCFSLSMWRWKTIVQNLGYSVSFSDVFAPQFAAFAIVYFIPVGMLWADILRTSGLKQKKQVPFSKGLASVLIDRIFDSAFNFVLAITGICFFFYKASSASAQLWQAYVLSIFFFFFIAFILVLFVFYPNTLRQIGLFDFFINSFAQQEEIEKIKGNVFLFFKKQNLACIFRVFSLSAARVVGIVFIPFLIVFFLGHPLSFSSTLAFVGPTFAALETPISADLGSHDLTSAFVLEALGLKRETGVAYAIIFRGSNLALSAVGLFFLLKSALAKWNRNIFLKLRLFKKNEQPRIS